MDIVTTVATLAAGVTGTLGTIKLIRFVSSRHEGPDEEERTERLFPNGEKDQIIAAINMLRVENVARQNENAQINATLRDIVGRLERHNI
jgi:hypothetical protein